MAVNPAEMAQAVIVDSATTQEPIVTQATEADTNEDDEDVDSCMRDSLGDNWW